MDPGVWKREGENFQLAQTLFSIGSKLLKSFSFLVRQKGGPRSPPSIRLCNIVVGWKSDHIEMHIVGMLLFARELELSAGPRAQGHHERIHERTRIRELLLAGDIWSKCWRHIT